MSHISNTLFIGKVLLRYNSLNSTNLAAQQLLAQQNKPIEGTTIVAEEQTEGKGQRGNAWQSPSGQNLLSSFILYPKHLLPKQQFNLNIIASLAVIDLLQEVGVTNAVIKWPNDIYINDNKVAGILIQNNIAGTQIASTIVGIGLNVNQTTFDPNLPNPTSLQNELNQIIDTEALLMQLCATLEKRYLQYKSKRGMEDMLSDYTAQMYRFGEVAQYLINGQSQPGIIKGIDEHGKLLLQMGGSIRAFEFQGLRFIV